MPSICERRLVVTGCVAVLLVLAPIGFAAPAAAQCLSETECDSLRTQLREIKSEARGLKEQIRNLQQKARNLPPDSPRRAEIRAEIRSLKQQLRTLRHEEARPLLQRFRQGCRAC